MFNSEMPFKTKTEVLDWFKSKRPLWYSQYEDLRDLVKINAFSGSAKLLKRENDDNVHGFSAFLTELNLAGVLLRKGKDSLQYEPVGTVEVDFVYDDVAVSVKNLLPKDYEKKEGEVVEEMKKTGDTKLSLSHKTKPFSSVVIDVQKNEMGTYTHARTEIGHSGFLDSDIYQMSPILKCLGKFEDVDVGGKKKVMFVGVHTGDFAHYYARDIGEWYFGGHIKPIFENDMEWYPKMFGKEEKNGSIDALIFIWPANPAVWPVDSFTDVFNDRERMLFYGKNKELVKELKSLFT